MIVMVPISPEVPRTQAPRLWPALLMMVVMMASYLVSQDRLRFDAQYAEDFPRTSKAGEPIELDDDDTLGPEAELYLSRRPLLVIAPARGDWDLTRLLLANFLHGSPAHLFLNLIGVFASVRLATTFAPFPLALLIFLLGGSSGLAASICFAHEPSAYIPHVGSSSGVFALLGLYYVFNFRFRTVYFFWFPSKNGFTKLRTSVFFFIDVFLIEFLLSVGQFFPDKIDSVDHLAHVVGFLSGVALAVGIRAALRWPGFLQTRAEFHHWRSLPDRHAQARNLVEGVILFRHLLQLNPCNDHLKLRLFALTAAHGTDLTPEATATIFFYLSPTFVRLRPRASADFIAHYLQDGLKMPTKWLRAIPYDSIILICKELAGHRSRRRLVLEVIQQYYGAHPLNDAHQRKLEQLARRLSEAEAS